MNAPAAGGLQIGLQLWTLRAVVAAARDLPAALAAHASHECLRRLIGPPPAPAN